MADKKITFEDPEQASEVEAALAGALAHVETAWDVLEFNGVLDATDTDRRRLALIMDDLSDIASRIKSLS